MRRFARWTLRVVLGLVGLVVLVVGVALLAAANLDARPMKGIVQGQARNQGIVLDYDVGGVTFGGLKFRGIRIAAPAKDAALTPSIVSVGAIDGRWSPLSLRVDDLVVRDVEVAVVMDEDGTTSLDRWLAGMPPAEPEPIVPLSHSLVDVIPASVTAHARVENITLRVIPRSGKEEEKILVTGLAAKATLVGGKLTLELPAKELRVALGKREAVVPLAATVAITPPHELRATLKVTVTRQTISPELPPVKDLVDLVASLDFQPEDKRTRLMLEKLRLVDGAAEADAQIELADTADGSAVPAVTAASCRLDLVALAKAVPPEMGPLVVEAEPLVCRAKNLELVPGPRGELALDGKIMRLSWRDIEVRGLGLAVVARPDGKAFTAKVSLPVESVSMPGLAVKDARIELGADHAGDGEPPWPLRFTGVASAADVTMPGQRVQGAKLTLSGTASDKSHLALEAAVDVDRFDGPAAVGKLHADITVPELALADDPLQSTGAIAVKGRLAHAEQKGTFRGEDLAFTLDARLAGREPASATLTVTGAQVTAAALGPEMARKPLKLEVDAPRIVLDHADLARSRGEATLSASLGDAAIEGKVGGSAAQVTWDLSGKAGRAGPARELTLVTRGSYGAEIQQDTTVTVARVDAAGTALRGAKVHIVSSGTLRKHQAQIDLAADGATVEGKRLGAQKLALTAAVDLDRPRIDLRLVGSRPDADLALEADVDGKRTVRWEMNGKIAKLGALAPFLPAGTSWDDVAIEVRGRGTVAGVVRGIVDGMPVLAADPARSARGKQSLDLTVRGLRYKGADETRADVDALTVKATADLGAARHVVVDIGVPGATATASGVNLEIAGFTTRLDATLGAKGEIDTKITVNAKEIKQSAAPFYPVRDATLAITVAGDPRGALVFRADLDNPGGGTQLDLKGQLEQSAELDNDLVLGRHSVALDGKLEQVLDGLDAAPETLRARGKITLPFRVESGDLSLFRTSASIRLEKVDVELPAQRIQVKGMNGVLPVVQEIVVADTGTTMVGQGERGIYPQLRFPDHQPFVHEGDYLSIAQVKWRDSVMGPLAGNVRVDRDLIALDQMEMNALGGKITGQCMVEVRGQDTRLGFRGKVTGVRPSSGTERLDANAAVTLTPYRLGLEGRVEIVRISKKHLLDLLEIYDPYHADVAANRVRLGLKFGYPKQVRLHFVRGFASLAVVLGGLAGAVRIDEIKGIPLGPSLATWLAPVLEE